MLSPYPQESSFLRLFDAGLDKWMEKAQQGKFTETDLPDFYKWGDGILKGSPGAPATANMHRLGDQLLLNGAKTVETGPYKGMNVLDAVHNIVADPELTSAEARRRFQQVGKGLGIENKVFSFILLVTGHHDTLVADRVRINDFWNAPGVAKKGLTWYTDPEGTRRTTENLYDNGFNTLWDGVQGLGMYEAAEKALADPVRQAYAARGIDDGTLGRWHWETWVAKSGQEVSHGSLGAIARRAQEQLPGSEATIGSSVRQGKFNDLSYGVRYEKTPDGYRFFWPKSDGTEVSLTPENHQGLLNTLRAMRDKAKLPSGFTENERAIQHKTKTNESTRAPWWNLPGASRPALDRLIDRFAPGEVGSGTPAGNRVPNGPGSPVEGLAPPYARGGLVSVFRSLGYNKL
jgi:hypothetical protein